MNTSHSFNLLDFDKKYFFWKLTILTFIEVMEKQYLAHFYIRSISTWNTFVSLKLSEFQQKVLSCVILTLTVHCVLLESIKFYLKTILFQTKFTLIHLDRKYFLQNSREKKKSAGEWNWPATPKICTKLRWVRGEISRSCLVRISKY